MTISIRNCNNIDSAEVSLVSDSLNVKYASNGVGKSTIAHAIAAFVNKDEEAKRSLLPFKYTNLPAGHTPEVIGFENVGSVKVFNETYVERFVFTPDALFPNAFNVFVKTEAFDKRMENINLHLVKIQMLFAENSGINDLLRRFDGFANGFGRSAKSLVKTSPIAKGIAKGNLVANIPAGLNCFAAYIQSERQNDWIKWHSEGDSFLELQQGFCPYCAQALDMVKDRIQLVAQKYDANAVKHLVNMVNVFKELAAEGLSTDSSKFVKDVTTNAEGIDEEDANRLLNIKKQVDELSQKLRTLQSISFYSEKDNPKKISEKLIGLRLDMTKFPDLKSDKVDAVVSEVNSTIDTALKSVETLQKEVAEQQKLIVDEIREYDEHINAFMELAGYPYRVSIEDLGNGNYKTRLSHIDTPDVEVLNAKEHLSYGERNAFALSMFVYDAISLNPDLVILDDPISSFDGNKKFALLKMMFWDEKWKTLAGKTVLMLTHDFCPVIDVMKTFADDFPGSPYAWYLRNEGGLVTELEIKKENVQSALKINKKNARQEGKDFLLRIVYYRKWLELKGEMFGPPYNVASNLEHLRSVLKCKKGDKLVDMAKEDIEEGMQSVRKCIKGFDYEVEVNRAVNVEVLKDLYCRAQCNFEKVLIFRYMFKAYEQRHGVEPALDGIIRKFMNEPFHIENDYLYQLNPQEFDPVSDAQIHLFDEKVEELLS